MKPVPLGIYISVPFCRSKCSFCNFASGVFSGSLMQGYVDRVCADVATAPARAKELGADLDRVADTIYLGGGTPTTLTGPQLQQMFATVRREFEVTRDAEITVECAPGTLTDEMLATLLACGVNRVSLGVQSFVNQETRSVARLHTREITLRDIERLRAAGITNIIVDLIAGLPYQTPESWQFTLDQVIATGVPHVSVYMLEVDEDSRLGRELIAGGQRYHAHQVPSEDLTADLYAESCERLEASGIRQYEISNFARPGWESRHNLKYWTRAPYVGFGVDAHSMLPAISPAAEREAIRFATPDTLERYQLGEKLPPTIVSAEEAREEELFLGLRMNRGVELTPAHSGDEADIAELVADGLMERVGNRICLTTRGRLLSNEVFARFLHEHDTAHS